MRRRWQLRGQRRCYACRNRPPSHTHPIGFLWCCPWCYRGWVTFTGPQGITWRRSRKANPRLHLG